MQKTAYCMIPYMRCPELAHLGRGIGCESHLRDFGSGGDLMLWTWNSDFGDGYTTL